ncbi:MAG: hypothetical protein H6850_02035 [Alphaproteobacteria bacterium]|nr:MAG: hypothetical protein H6850_02035 [Alphaproteobacteria bacterium]
MQDIKAKCHHDEERSGVVIHNGSPRDCVPRDDAIALLKIPYLLWCTLADLSCQLKGQFKQHHFHVFSHSPCTKVFCDALINDQTYLNVEVELDEVYMSKDYVNDELKKNLEQQISMCFDKKVTFQFCIYRF